MSEEDFIKIFSIMTDYFDAKPSEVVTQIYFESFKNWKIENFKLACQSIMENRKFNGLPKIAEIIEVIKGKEEDKVIIAYQTLIETLRNHAYWDSVVFEDGAIGNAVMDMGGWIAISEWTIEDWKYRRKEFENLYRAHLKRGNIQSIRLGGAFEKDNGEKGLIDHIPKAFLIEDKSKIQKQIDFKMRSAGEYENGI